jgi:hypothetical protein
VSKDKLSVRATSDLGDQADLQVTIDMADAGSVTRVMTWKARKNRWERTIKKFADEFGSQPLSVTVFGPEGLDSTPVENR